MMGYIFFRNCAKSTKQRHRCWATLKDAKLCLYKTYKDYYETLGSVAVSHAKIKEVELGVVEVEIHKERDDDYGFYIKIRTSTNGSYEVWTDTLKEYELWIAALNNKTSITAAKSISIPQ